MSVAEITPIERYTGDGKQTEFPVGWRFNHPSHLKLVSSTARLLVPPVVSSRIFFFVMTF